MSPRDIWQYPRHAGSSQLGRGAGHPPCPEWAPSRVVGSETLPRADEDSLPGGRHRGSGNTGFTSQLCLGFASHLALLSLGSLRTELEMFP